MSAFDHLTIELGKIMDAYVTFGEATKTNTLKLIIPAAEARKTIQVDKVDGGAGLMARRNRKVRLNAVDANGRQLRPCGSALQHVYALRTNHNPIVDHGHARRRPCNALRFLTLDPGVNRAFQHHCAAFGFNGDAIGVDLGVSLERFLDLAFKF